MCVLRTILAVVADGDSVRRRLFHKGGLTVWTVTNEGRGGRDGVTRMSNLLLQATISVSQLLYNMPTPHCLIYFVDVFIWMDQLKHFFYN